METGSAVLDKPAALEPSIKIAGGEYEAVDTLDGYHTLKRVPIMCTVAKGAKGAPEEIGRDWQEQAVAYAQQQYREGKFVGPAHEGHNDPIHKAEFAGFVLPSEVGKMRLDGRDEDAIFADIKVKNATFEKIRKGELPYVSVEVLDWKQPKIDSLAFLNTRPPYFPFPIVTVGKRIVDPAAKFDAQLKNPAQFNLAYTGLASQPVGGGPKASEQDALSMCMSLQERVAVLERLVLPGGNVMSKPDATPVEPDKVAGATAADKAKEPAPAKMSKQDDPPAAKPAEGAKLTVDGKDVVAQFAAMTAKQDAMAQEMDALKAKEKAREDEIKLRATVDKALGELKAYQLSDAMRSNVAKFAAMGDEALKGYLDTLKQMPRTLPASVEALEAEIVVDASEPVLAQFQKEGPAVMEKAVSALKEYRALKGSPLGKRITATAEQYVAGKVKRTF